MDKMQGWELGEYINQIEYLDINSWEQTRYLVYAIAQSNSTKRLNPKDLLKLPWEVGDDGLHEIEMTNEQRDNLKKKAQQYLKTLNNNNVSTT